MKFARIARLALLALSAGMLARSAATAASRPPRIVAVGDLHGDHEAWLRIAAAAGLIDASGHWSGGSATLVQLGDIVDRWGDSLAIIRSLQQLQAQAPRSGGRVIILLGNHEAMNLLGDNRYTTAGEYAAFADQRSTARREQYYIANRIAIEAEARKSDPAGSPSAIRDRWLAAHPLGWVEHQRAWSPSGELGKWASRNPAIVNIGGTLFVHGGLSAEYSTLSLDEINRRAAVAMARADQSPTGILSDPLGPLWYRGLVIRDADAEAERKAAKTPSLPAEQELDRVLAAAGAKRIVVGHTASRGPIQLLYGGRLARIDTAISRAYGGTLSWLEIVGPVATAHSVERNAQ